MCAGLEQITWKTTFCFTVSQAPAPALLTAATNHISSCYQATNLYLFQLLCLSSQWADPICSPGGDWWNMDSKSVLEIFFF